MRQQAANGGVPGAHHAVPVAEEPLGSASGGSRDDAPGDGQRGTPLSHVSEVAGEQQQQQQGQAHAETEAEVEAEAPLPQGRHTAVASALSLLTDVGALVESPTDEPDEADVLEELLGGSYATGGFSSAAYNTATTSPWSRRQRGSGSYSSYRSWRADRSVNPAREVEASLSSLGSLSLVADVVGQAVGMAARAMDTNVVREDGVGGQVRGDGRTMDRSLPDDDGMKSLREKLQEIRILTVSMEEKAKRMHDLMTQDWLAHKAAIGGLSDGASLHLPRDPRNPYNLKPADLEPSFSPHPVVQQSSEADRDESVMDDLPAVLGCMHYKRNVKVQCFDCRRWYTCRHCHDSSIALPFPHLLNRKKTENMLCMLCRTPQPATEVCINCGEYAAWYFCPKCKLWDNDSNKRIYHCDDCGICRVGEGLGKDFVHCRRCNVCISISTSASHPCIERATEGDCPLCLVRLFESQTPVVSLPCGHYMHGECYKDLMAVTYKCPVCSKSAVNMELQWRKLDDEIRAQPMPDDDADLEGLMPHAVTVINDDEPVTTNGETHGGQPRRPKTVYVGCNDCGRRSWTPFHWLGLKCQVCDSYNTNQMAPTAVQETEAERLIRQQQQRHRQHDFTGNAVLRDAGIGATEAIQVDDAVLDVPHSPSQIPNEDELSTSGPQSPSRSRYFVQTEEQRRPNFTGSRFSTSSLPTLPNLSNLPHLPNLPDIPRLPRMPNIPNMPNMPNIELPRFSPYEMFDAVSRSLSPMRYYLQGLDVDGRDRRRSLDAAAADRNRSPTSVHSDPTADATGPKRHPLGSDASDDEGVEFWASEGQSFSGGEDGDGTDDSVHAMERGEETSSSESESEIGEGKDAEMVDGEGVGEDEDAMDLPGHR